MEITNAYKKVLELEGLILILKSDDADDFKIDSTFKHLYEKLDELEYELSDLRKQCDARLCATPVSGIAPAQCNQNEQSDGNMPDAESEAVAANALFEEGEDAGSDLVEEKEDNTDTEAPRRLDIGEPGSLPQPVVDREADDMVEMRENGPDNVSADEISRTETVSTSDKIQNNVNIITDDPGVDVNRSAFACKAKGDIRKAFTLNDNYKFRRQLFSNSQENYNDALSTIESKRSLYEAEEYLYGDLKWDKEDPDVKDFMVIISAYFLNKR